MNEQAVVCVWCGNEDVIRETCCGGFERVHCPQCGFDDYQYMGELDEPNYEEDEYDLHP